MSQQPLFHHIYEDNQAPQTLVLLHGTGGDEHDLLPLALPLREQYNFLGLRGNVQEKGMNRFFARREFGVFDQASIVQETEKLAQFLHHWMEERALPASGLAFLGYSNGANMILALLFRFPDLVRRAAVLHPMLPFVPTSELDLSGHELLVTYGEQDPMVASHQSQQVITVLQERGAAVYVVSHAGGHELREGEVAAVTKFFLKP